MNSQTKECYTTLPSPAKLAQSEWAGGSVLLTRSDLQAVLKLSARTITRLVATGGIPAPIVVGRSFRWRTSDIEQFIEGAASASDEASKCVELSREFTSRKDK